MTELLVNTPRGLYCEQGDFYIDPWKPVERAVITHAHSDHARAESEKYLCPAAGAAVLRQRLGQEITLETLEYGEVRRIGDVDLSFHPAGHILGSSQVRIEHKGEVWVASGDYKVQHDPTCPPFEPVRCHTFITEATFSLPVYDWPDMAIVYAEINDWWKKNQAHGRTSVVFAYALGKAQRILSGLSNDTGPIFVTTAVHNLTEVYRQCGVALPLTQLAEAETVKALKGAAIVVAPPSLGDTGYLKKFGPVSTAFASGWMRIRGQRRRQNLDRGFIVSDHADWKGLHQAIGATGAQNIIVTHGFNDVFARWLRERGYNARTFATQYEGDAAT